MQPPTTGLGPPPSVIRVSDGDGPIVYGALTGAILVLTTVIAVLWRRGEKHRDRSLKAAEEAREREVKRTEDLLIRIESDRVKFGQLIEAQRDAFIEVAESQRKDFLSAIETQRSSFEATLKTMAERQALSDEKRDTKVTDVVNQLMRVVESTQSRIARQRG